MRIDNQKCLCNPNRGIIKSKCSNNRRLKDRAQNLLEEDLKPTYLNGNHKNLDHKIYREI